MSGRSVPRLKLVALSRPRRHVTKGPLPFRTRKLYMKGTRYCSIALVSTIAWLAASQRSLADDPSHSFPSTDLVSYFEPLKSELRKEWPRNRTIRFVFHGHSVPAGYFKTPIVRTFDAYPTLFHQQLCERYPTAVIDVCVTAIGGENSVAGAARFNADVLALKPDVVFIDYSLNDRGVGLEKAEAAWRSMIDACMQEERSSGLAHADARHAGEHSRRRCPSRRPHCSGPQTGCRVSDPGRRLVCRIPEACGKRRRHQHVDVSDQPSEPARARDRCWVAGRTFHRAGNAADSRRRSSDGTLISSMSVLVGRSAFLSRCERLSASIALPSSVERSRH